MTDLNAHLAWLRKANDLRESHDRCSAEWHCGCSATAMEIAQTALRAQEDRDTALRQRDEARAEERRAIVAFLHRRVQDAIKAPMRPSTANTTAVYVASITGEAARIERGEHLDDAALGAARPPEEGA